MRACKAIMSFLTALCLLFSLCAMGIAEEDIVSAPVDIEVGEVDSIGANGLFTEEEDVVVEETSEPEAKAVAATSSDFEIDEDGTLLSYTGIDNAITIPKGVKEIGYDVFYGDENIESIVIPDGVTRIDSYAFAWCPSLKSVSLPDSITEIGGYAFEGCESLTSVKLPKNLTTVSNGLFAYCDSLETVTVQKGATSIGSGAFTDCNGLKTIVIPSSVTAIGDSFQYCSALESISIPSSVTKIDRTAFNGCENLVIRGVSGSYAEQYAKSLKIPFNAPIITFNIPEIEDGYDREVVLHISKSRTIDAVQKPSDLATKLVWTSSDPKIASVDGNGKVTGVSEGIATITASTADGNGRPAQVAITVPEPTSISLYTSETEHLTVDETMWISAYIYTPYSSIAEFPAVWASYDSSIVSIESSGETSSGNSEAYVKAHKVGTATVSVSTADGGLASVEITVGLPSPTSITIDQSAPESFHPGDTFDFTATMTPANAASALTWYSSDNNIATVDSSGKVTAVAPGTATISVRTENYEVDYVSVTVSKAESVTKVNLSKAKVSLKTKSYTYNGKAREPSVTVKLDGATLKKGTDYTVTYKDNKNAGMATATIKGFGRYTGSVKQTFTIKPAKVSGLKVKAGSKKLTVTWKKGKGGITGYEIQYGTKKSASGAKKVKITKASTVKKVLTKLKAKNTYYVRIRAYKKVGKRYIYSAWSKYKKIKTK